MSIFCYLLSLYLALRINYLLDPENEKACDVEWQYTEDGERVRVSNASGR